MIDLKTKELVEVNLSKIRQFPFIQGHKSNKEVDKVKVEEFVSLVESLVSENIGKTNEVKGTLIIVNSLQQRQVELVENTLSYKVYKKTDKRKEYMDNVINLIKSESIRLMDKVY